MAEKPHKTLTFADLHCGSRLGLLPPDFTLPDLNSLDLDGTEYAQAKERLTLNKGQVYLWQNWLDQWKALPPKMDIGVLVGDGVQGPAKNNSTPSYTVISYRPSVQCAILKAILKPIRHRFKDFFMVSGTEWHEGELSEWMTQLAADSEIDAHPYPSGALMEDMLFLDHEGIVLDIAHDISYFMIYRGTPLEREINFARIDECLVEGAPDVIARFHVHTLGIAQNRHAVAFSGPGWQLSGRHARKKSPARGRISDIGSVLINAYPERKKRWKTQLRKESPIELEIFRYPHPRYKAMKI